MRCGGEITLVFIVGGSQHIIIIIMVISISLCHLADQFSVVFTPHLMMLFFNGKSAPKGNVATYWYIPVKHIL